jgi:hypothetical protein
LDCPAHLTSQPIYRMASAMCYRVTMRRIMLFSCLALAAGGCGQTTDDTTFDGSIEDRVKFIAVVSNNMLPMDMGDGFTLVSINPDGRVLELQIDTTVEGSVDVSSAALTRIFRPEVCGNDGYRGIIDKGGVIRFKVTRNSTHESLPPFSIAHCG